MEVIKYHPHVYKLHDYITSKAIGKINSRSQLEAAAYLGIVPSSLYIKKVTMALKLDSIFKLNNEEIKMISSAERYIRKLREQINDENSPFMVKILSCVNGLYCATQEEAEREYEAVGWRKIKAGVAMIKEGQSLHKSIKDNNQYRLKLSEYMKEIVEIGV